MYDGRATRFPPGSDLTCPRSVLSTPAYVKPDRFDRWRSDRPAFRPTGVQTDRSSDRPVGRDRARHHRDEVLDEGLVVEHVARRTGGALLGPLPIGDGVEDERGDEAVALVEDLGRH